MKRIMCTLITLVVCMLTACTRHEATAPTANNTDKIAVVDREDAIQIETGMRYEDVSEILGATLVKEGERTKVQEYALIDGGKAYFTYWLDSQGVCRVSNIHIASLVEREKAEQVKKGMSYEEVIEILGPTADRGSGTIVQEYFLSDSATAYFSYTMDTEGIFRVTNIYIDDTKE